MASLPSAVGDGEGAQIGTAFAALCAPHNAPQLPYSFGRIDLRNGAWSPCRTISGKTGPQHLHRHLAMVLLKIGTVALTARLASGLVLSHPPGRSIFESLLCPLTSYWR